MNKMRVRKDEKKRRNESKKKIKNHHWLLLIKHNELFVITSLIHTNQ